MKTHFEKLVNWFGKNELIPVFLENKIYNLYLIREVKSTRNNNVNDVDHYLTKNCQQISKWEKKEEESLEAVIPRVRMNPKNPSNEEKQELEDSGHAVSRSWCAACVEGRGVGGQHRIELLEEDERERTTPIVAFDYGFLTQEDADTFVETAGMVKRERHVVNGKVPQHTPFHFLWV